MQQTILRRDVVAEIRSGAPFDMEFVTADRKRGTGGDLISVEGWLKVDFSDEKKAKSSQAPEKPGSGSARDPHNEENGTINIFNPENAGYHPITVHIDLIQTFNAKRVIN